MIPSAEIYHLYTVPVWDLFAKRSVASQTYVNVPASSCVPVSNDYYVLFLLSHYLVYFVGTCRIRGFHLQMFLLLGHRFELRLISLSFLRILSLFYSLLISTVLVSRLFLLLLLFLRPPFPIRVCGCPSSSSLVCLFSLINLDPVFAFDFFPYPQKLVF